MERRQLEEESDEYDSEYDSEEYEDEVDQSSDDSGVSGVPWYLYDGEANAQVGVQVNMNKRTDIDSL